MRVLDSHWVDSAKREVVTGGAEMRVRRFLVIHYTAGATALSSINFWRTPAAKGTSAHFVIDRDGTLYQCRPCNRTCGHAGESRWRDPKTKVLYTGLNSCSIGIELANAGSKPALAKRWSKLPPMSARHKHGGPVALWEAYPQAQLDTCFALSKVLCVRYYLDDVVGHEDIAPARKNDPGPAFPMADLRTACGFPPGIVT